MTVRERLVELARSYVDCGVTDQRERYLDLVADGETPQMRDMMASPRTSGCALVIRGMWKRLGLQDTRLQQPYRIGQAVADLIGIARQHDAFTDPVGQTPEPGDVVLVGGGPDGGGFEHVYVVQSCRLDEPTWLAYIHSTDGGQVDERGNQVIRAKSRHWRTGPGGVWDQVDRATDPGALAHRKVRGWVDVDLLPWPDFDPYED